MHAIEAVALTKSFDNLTAVDGLNLTVEEGEIFGLVGPDGAGKTTTMRLLTSIMEPTSGEAWVAGHNVLREAEAVKEEIGYMSQRFGLKGVTTFVTTHYMDEAEYCNRIGLIYRGELIAIGSPDTLKTEFMQEEVLEVICERPQDAMGEIEKLRGIQEVALFGKGLHVIAQDAGRATSDIRNLLGTTASVEKIAPSLEDVFVSLIESRDRADQPQQEVRK